MPSSDFEPSLEDVERLAGGVSTSVVGRRQPHLRVLLASHDGFLRYGYAFPHALALPRIFLPSGVSLRPWHLELPAVAPLPDGAAGRDGGRRALRSAQGALTLRRRGPLPEPGLDPDPLTRFALAMQEVEEGELVEVALDFRALRPDAAYRWRQTQERRAEVQVGIGAAQAVACFLLGMAGASGSPKVRGGQRPQEVRPAGRGIVFGFRALARARAAEPSRARYLAELAGRAPLVALAAGRAEVGWDWLDPQTFAARWGGKFRAASAVRFEEVAGLLVPPTVKCPAPNVRREVMLAEPPPGLAEWTPERADLVPVGRVRERDLERAVGVPLSGFLFGAEFGRSRWGKTDDIQLLFRHLTRVDGGLFFDPDQDGLERLLRYFGHEPGRVVYVNLAPQQGPATVPGWNLFAVTSAAQIPRAVATLKDAFVASAGWDSKRAPRATTLVVMAAQAMCEIALLCQPDDAPTMFQILTLLEDAKWRAAVIRHLSPRLHRWWKREFAKMPDDAILPITNLVRKFEESPGTLAFFGSSRTTYDVRAAADARKVVLVCPAGEGDEETRMLTALLTNDAIRAILSRRDVVATDEARPWFSVVVDECQEVPAYMIARAVEHFGKYHGRLVCANQDPSRLPEAMRNALFTNCSMVKSTAVGWSGAKVVEREFGGKVRAETIGALDRYHFATLFRPERGQVQGPFGARGLGLEQTLGPGDPEGPAKVRAAAVGHKTVDEVRADQATLDDRIRLWLAGKELSERDPVHFGHEAEPWAADLDGEEDDDLGEWDGRDLTDEDEDF